MGTQIKIINTSGQRIIKKPKSNQTNLTSDGITLSLNDNPIPTHISVSYADLVDLINNVKLTPLAYYLITDFKTRAIIQFTGDLPSGVGNELVQEGTLEPLLVQALSANTLSNTAQSILYPQDKILYRLSPLQSDYDYQVPNSLGVIYYRQDQDIMVAREYDWRNIKFRRWETSPENQDFTNFVPVADSAYVDYAPFENCGIIHNLNLRNSEEATSYFSLPYILDNTVIKYFGGVSTVTISCFGNTIVGLNYNENPSQMFSNNINTLAFSTIKAQNIVFNSGDFWTNVTFLGVDGNSQFNSNQISALDTINISGSFAQFQNNSILTLSEVQSDVCTDNRGSTWITSTISNLTNNDIAILNNVQIEEVSNNILNELTNSSNTLTGAKITDNVGNQIDNNSSFHIRDNNVTYITNNNDTPDSTQEIELNVGTYIIDCGASIYENNVSTIAGCYNTGVVTANIARSIYNLGGSIGNIVGNNTSNIGTCYNLTEIANNILSDKIYAVSGDNTILKNNTGQQLNGVETAGDFIDNNGVNIANSSIASAVQNTTFNGLIGNKTITPTASIQATTPSVVKYDAGLTEFVEETITLGVVTYSAAITS